MPFCVPFLPIHAVLCTFFTGTFVTVPFLPVLFGRFGLNFILLYELYLNCYYKGIQFHSRVGFVVKWI